jgi:hypothetical protein
MLFHTQQYPPYLNKARNDSCTAVSHTAVPAISIYTTYRQLHCCFTHSSTHHIYIQYVTSVALLFHKEQYPPYLYTLRNVSCTAVSHTAVHTSTFSCTAVSQTAVNTISIYSTYRQFHCCFTQNSTHHNYIQYVPSVALLLHTQQYSPYLYTERTDSCTAVSHTAVPNISIYRT